MTDPSVATVMVLLSIFSVCGIIGNSLVLYIYSHKKEKSTAGIFIMSLAGTDLFTSLFIMPFTEAVVYLDYMLKSDAACKIYMFFITCNIPFAAFIMVAIATDRYFCICHPFLYVLNIKRAKIIVVCLLVAASIFGIVTSLMHGVYVYEPYTLNFSDITSTNNNANVTSSGEYAFYTTANVNNSVDEHFLSLVDSVWTKSTVNLSNNDTEETATASSFSDTISRRKLVFNGICQPNFIIIGHKYVDLYQKFYAGTYLVSFFAVVVLYGLIYKSIHKHRAKRNKRKRSSLYPSGVEFSTVETQFTAVTHVNPHKRSPDEENGIEPPEVQPMNPKPRHVTKPLSIKEKTLIANIRTAAMLFVVTAVFLVAFLPAWLMAHRLLEYNIVIFHMYFVYHTANPFIYAFMNKSFRDDLGKVLKCQSMPMVR